MSKNQRAVIIEDDYTAGSVISDFLEDEGYTVKSYRSPEEAKGEIQPIDILIVDVRINANPSAGVDFVISLKKDTRFNDTKIIFISNFGKEKIEEKLKQLSGKFRWLDKPFEMYQLAVEIEGGD